MPITYTSRKGLTYYLCQGLSKTGRPRYYFAREPKGEPLEQIPAGYKISESVNGVVSLVKDRPALILPSELEAVETELHRHPQGARYCAAVKHDRIEIYERVGPDIEQVLGILGPLVIASHAAIDEARADLDRHAQFTPVLRFILNDAGRRIFRVERMCYLGSIDDWIDIGRRGSLDRLARRVLPALGTDEFFELGMWQEEDDGETTE